MRKTMSSRDPVKIAVLAEKSQDVLKRQMNRRGGKLPHRFKNLELLAIATPAKQVGRGLVAREGLE